MSMNHVRENAHSLSGLAKHARGLQSSTALAGLFVLLASVSGAAHADSCQSDDAHSSYLSLKCVGNPGANGANGSKYGGSSDKAGRPGQNGESLGGGGYGLPQDFAGSPGVPTLFFSGIGGAGGNGGNGGIETTSDGGDGGRGGNGWDFELGLGGAVRDGGNALSPVTVISQGGAGGRGGEVGTRGVGGKGGDGGSGGHVNFHQESGSIQSTAPGVTAVVLRSDGGNAGQTIEADEDFSAVAKNGADGGNGGSIDGVVRGSIVSAGSGIYAESLGGNGSNGGRASSSLGTATGGNGGNGGAGGTVTLLLDHGSIVAQGDLTPLSGLTIDGKNASINLSPPVAAMWGLVGGGLGGNGGVGSGGLASGNGGHGGGAQSNGIVDLSNSGGSIATSGYAAAGMVGQSIGGGGGNGAYGGGMFIARGGTGNPGGSGGAVLLSSEGGSIHTAGDASPAMVAQSIGGGGGFGGSVQVIGLISSVALGGMGGRGGDGGYSQIQNGVTDSAGATSDGQVIRTEGLRSIGMLAQSIGGGGGVGGDAFADNFLNGQSLAIGGAAGSGGSGGVVFVRNGGIVYTTGKLGYGIEGQSIGGGGGNGGSAFALQAGTMLNSATAIGGTGGDGGIGGSVGIYNFHQIATDGAAATGILAQSIGGGGGNGGSSLASVVDLFVPNPEAPSNPSIDSKTSIGGQGGKGGDGGSVVVGNTGSIVTNGTGATAVQAMSVGGGGGNGGDADAFELAVQTPGISISTVIGGTGGAAGRGGSVDLTNGSGSIETYGDGSTAVFVQSIAGGGGNGGNASSRDLNIVPSTEIPNVEVNTAVGGAGGSGNVGGAVTIANQSGRILTTGNDSKAVFAQSVGGGGGNGGGGVAMGSGASSGSFAFNIGVGGSGGSGNDGGKVTVTNSGTILTTGGNSTAIYAQSIGGGGGTGGSGAGKSGSSGTIQIADFLAERAGVSDDVIKIADGIYEIKAQAGEAAETLESLKELAELYEASKSNPDFDPDWGTNIASLIHVNVGGGFGGAGGAGGNGGTVAVTNDGTIETTTAYSDAIFAQSIGGGGGDAGAAHSSAGAVILNANFAVGGRGGSSGRGGDITVANSGNIITTGDLSHGINAQSVGGGGGRGGGTVGTAGPGGEVTLSLGGDGGSSGNGGAVKVVSDGSVDLSGEGSIGILAQSIGGGGGELSLLGSHVAEGGEAESEYEFGLIPMLPAIGIGGKDGSGGDGGQVNVTENGAITTTGRDSYGILAQSIGGGGGVIFTPATGISSDEADETFGEGALKGNGSRVDVTLGTGASITTSGDGAVGILAQSIGGGGGLIGGMSDVSVYTAAARTTEGRHEGSGGDVSVYLEDGSAISTTGRRADGIVAQSTAGGGFFAGEDGAGFSVARQGGGDCTTCLGLVSVTVNGSVQVAGPESYGLFAQNIGNPHTGVAVRIGANGTIGAIGDAAAALYIDSNGPNVIENSGVISGGSSDAIAIDGSAATINNHGTITGDINGRTEADQHVINNDGVIWANQLIMASQLTNSGQIITGADHSRVATLTGNLTSTGDIVSSIDRADGEGMLAVDGTASLSGRVLLYGSPVSQSKLTVLTADKLTLIDPVNHPLTFSAADYDPTTGGVTVYANSPFAFSGAVVNNQALVVTPQLKSASQLGGNLTPNEAAVADQLSRAFAAGSTGYSRSGFESIYSHFNDVNSYVATLDTIGGQAFGALAASRLTLQRSFISSMMSCPAFAGASAAQHEGNCVWARLGGSWIDSHGDVGFHTKSTNYQIGTQKDLGNDWFLGGSGSYQDINLVSRAAASRFAGDLFSLGAFVKHQSGNWLFGGSVSGAVGHYNSRREVMAGASLAEARPTVQNLGLQARVAYQVPGNGWYLKPSVDLTAQYVHMDGFTEHGSDFPLQVSSQGDWSYSVAPNLELGSRLTVGRTLMRPYVQLGGIFQRSSGWAYNATFADSSVDIGSFVSKVDLPDAMGHVAAGIEGYAANGLTIRAEYGAELARHFKSQTGLLRLSYRF